MHPVLIGLGAAWVGSAITKRVMRSGLGLPMAPPRRLPTDFYRLEISGVDANGIPLAYNYSPSTGLVQQQYGHRNYVYSKTYPHIAVDGGVTNRHSMQFSVDSLPTGQLNGRRFRFYPVANGGGGHWAQF